MIKLFQQVLTYVLLFSFSNITWAQTDTDVNLTDLSQELLEKVRERKDTKTIRSKLASIDPSVFESQLTTDEKRLAFWLNIYNGYIQAILLEHPEYYDDRRNFFGKRQIPIAKDTLSFAKIEHGIIRKSQWELGLGLIPHPHPTELEKRLRVQERDWRIHFALNCGANDCPPVAIYEPETLDEQLIKSTTRYLTKNSNYDPDNGEVAVTSLFSWFRGDFKFSWGIKSILEKLEIIPEDTDVELKYKSYDWTLNLDNWIDL